MLVKCITNKPIEIPQRYNDDQTKNMLSNYQISENKIFVVYAVKIEANSNLCYYYVMDEDDFFPKPNPAPLFNIMESKVSKYWEFRRRIIKDEKDGEYFYISFKEWIDEDFFYARLVDGEERETEIFYKYKKLMDAEHEILV